MIQNLIWNFFDAEEFNFINTILILYEHLILSNHSYLQSQNTVVTNEINQRAYHSIRYCLNVRQDFYVMNQIPHSILDSFQSKYYF